MAEWNFDRLNEDEDEENEEEEGSSFQWGTKDGMIFLIDCSKSMFTKEQDEESSFELCIKCAKNTIQNKIISSDKDVMAIVFYATEKSQNATDFKHVYVFHDLGLPGAEKVMQLEKLLETADNDDFENKFGHSTEFSLSDALWTCSNLFSKCTQKLGFKRILLFTNNDNPHNDDAQLMVLALFLNPFNTRIWNLTCYNKKHSRNVVTRVEDLQQNSIDLELLHINKPEKPFDLDLFYKDILYADDDEKTLPQDASEKFEELLNRVRVKNHKKRAMTRLPLTLGLGISLSVGVYNLVRSCTRPAAVKLYKKSNEEVKTVTKTFLKETGEVLMPQDLKKCQTYATKKISFEPEEVTQIKTFDKSGLELMGFKPKSSIKPYFHVRPAQFLYPDESMTIGSTTLFTALLIKCLEKNIVAICRYIPRKNSPPKFVALWPQEEELDEKHVQITPPGFHIIFLPFADDFRKLKLDDEKAKANADQVEKGKDLIKKIQFAFRCESFENPALQKHYANVEAMALERDAPEEISDFTIPDMEKIDKRAGKVAKEFSDLVFPEGYQPGAGSRKRPAKAAAKTDDGNSEIDIEKEAKAGRLNKLTVPILKEYAKKLNITLTGSKKADIVDSICEHFGV